MYKDELKKKYDKLVSEIEETRMYDGRGKGVDVYLCERCNGVFLTRYRDKGVTPFTIKCRWCNEGYAMHKSTVSEQNAEEMCKRQGITVKEWVRPSFEQLLKMNGGLQAHVLDGGLVLDEETEKDK